MAVRDIQTRDSGSEAEFLWPLDRGGAVFAAASAVSGTVQVAHRPAHFVVRHSEAADLQKMTRLRGVRSTSFAGTVFRAAQYFARRVEPQSDRVLTLRERPVGSVAMDRAARQFRDRRHKRFVGVTPVVDDLVLAYLSWPGRAHRGAASPPDSWRRCRWAWRESWTCSVGGRGSNRAGWIARDRAPSEVPARDQCPVHATLWIHSSHARGTTRPVPDRTGAWLRWDGHGLRGDRC